MDPLLARQLRKHLPGLDPADPQYRGFLAAVETAYRELRADRAFTEHTLETTSRELTEANETIRRESETKLASLSRYYQQTLELQQGMIKCVRLTPRGFEYTLCRGQLLQRLGYTPAQFEGHTIDEIVDPTQATLVKAQYARAWAGEAFSTTITSPNGVELLILLRPRLENGTVVEVIVSCVEITALKEAERALIAAKERAEAADRAKSEFLAVMGHEMRTPLNAVIGFADLLLTTPLTPQQQAWLRTVGTSGESLLTLINAILDFTRLESGRATLHPEPGPLAPLLDEITTRFAAPAAAKRLALHVTAPPAVPALVTLDWPRLRQVLGILVDNAIKFTPAGSVHLRVTAAPTGAADGPGTLQFTVTDTGLGIPPDRTDRLFKPFSQADASATRDFGGAGLGLAIADRLVRLLGGEIRHDPAPGGGAIFTFTVRGHFAPAETAAASPDDNPAASAPRILVAEAHPLNRELIQLLLESRGCRPLLVATGPLALHAIRQRPYDLILLDLDLPNFDALAAAREILAQADLAHPPAIYALKNNAQPEDHARCAAVGLQGVLTKPLDSRALFAALDTLEPATVVL